jgi:hypothetical protein
MHMRAVVVRSLVLMENPGFFNFSIVETVCDGQKAILCVAHHTAFEGSHNARFCIKYKEPESVRPKDVTLGI